jgi:pimeloyl-ACP methyl ester carboxylesterase
MGGQIAVKLVTQYAHPFQKLVLVAPAGFEHFTLSEKLILEQLTTNNGLINQIQYYKFILQMKDYFYELNEKEYQKLTELNRHFYDLKQNPNLTITLESSIKAMLQEPILALLPKIKLPTLVFFGKNDKLIPNKLLHHTLSTAYIAQSACKRIKDVKLLLYDKCGHFLPYEYPTKFNIDLHKFITNLDATQEA